MANPLFRLIPENPQDSEPGPSPLQWMTYLRNYPRKLRLITSIVLGGLVATLLLLLATQTHGQSPIVQNSNGNTQSIGALVVQGIPHQSDATGGADIVIDDYGVLIPFTGPSGIGSDIVYVPNSEDISLYVVQEGDTLGHIAELFNVSINTIRWANDISTKNTISPGQVLTILPITSVQHTVQKGETLASITKKYGGDVEETALFNGLSSDSSLVSGQIVLIPDGALNHDNRTTPASVTTPSAKKITPTEEKTQKNYFTRAWGGIVSQGFHGAYRAIDYAMPIGTTIGASAGGTVIAAKSPSGWNGGYGGFIVIKHNNGAQTLYAHLSELKVGVGQNVQQGQVIGLSGNTGRSTGPHLHFEIRGWGDVPKNMR